MAGDSERSKVGARMLLRHSYTTDHPIRLGVSEGSEVVNLEALMLLLNLQNVEDEDDVTGRHPRAATI